MHFHEAVDDSKVGTQRRTGILHVLHNGVKETPGKPCQLESRKNVKGLYARSVIIKPRLHLLPGTEAIFQGFLL